jgi:hypothetical protein
MSNLRSNASDETQLDQLLKVAVIVLQQGMDLVEKHLTSDDQLTYQSQYIPGSTIGMSVATCIITTKAIIGT